MKICQGLNPLNVHREFKAWGVRVIESNESLTGPEEEKDFWEGEQFQVGEEMVAMVVPWHPSNS